MDLILGMACGIAVYHMINYLKQLKDNKFKTGDENVCNDCIYKKAVMESLADEQA